MKPLIAASLGIVMWCGSASAQLLPLKRGELESIRADECPVLRIIPPAQAPRTTVTDSLLAAGSRAAILGDQEAARDLLGQAAAQDPANPVASYRLARTLDEVGDSRSALSEYCRYLNLAPTGAEAGSIRTRVRELVTMGTPLPDDPWAIAVRAGIGMYESGQYAEAAASFTSALEIRPNSAETRFNRGLVNMAAGDSANAAADLRAYLTMAPQAEDRDAVSARLAALAPAAPPSAAALQPTAAPRPVRMASPGTALIEGLLIPGLGQHATGRTLLGVMVLGAAGGAVYMGTRTQPGTQVITAQDPFGNEYEYEAEVLERPYAVAGIAAAAGIALVGAVESFLYARRAPRSAVAMTSSPPAVVDDPKVVALTVGPGGDAVRVGLRIRLGGR